MSGAAMTLADFVAAVVPSRVDLWNMAEAITAVLAVAAVLGGFWVIVDQIGTWALSSAREALARRRTAHAGAPAPAPAVPVQPLEAVAAAGEPPENEIPRPFGVHDDEWRRMQALGRERRRVHLQAVVRTGAR